MTKTTAIFMAILIVMLPVCFADSLTYDNNGNLVTGDGLYRKYNSLNQLWKVYNGSEENESKLLEEYTYHPVEERVLIKNVSNPEGSWRETVYYVSDEFVRVVNASGTYDFTYIKHEGQRVAELKPDGSKIYMHPDHLGSTTLVTDSNGNGIENTSYTPYGVILEGGEQSRFSYEGQEYSSVVDDYDFHFRKYKAEWGVFTQPDTLIQDVYDPQTLNRYSFERGNPYKYTDESGHQGCLTPGCSVEIGIVSVAPWLAIPGSVAVAYYGGTKLREAYPPSQLAADLSSVYNRAYDYVYEYVDAIKEPMEDLLKMYKTLQDLDKLKTLSDTLKGDLKKEVDIPGSTTYHPSSELYLVNGFPVKTIDVKSVIEHERRQRRNRRYFVRGKGFYNRKQLDRWIEARRRKVRDIMLRKQREARSKQRTS